MAPPPARSQLDSSAAVTLLFGDADILKTRAIATMEEDEEEADVTVLEGRELDKERMGTELSGRSLLAAKRIVVIKRVDEMDADGQEDLVRALERLPDDIQVIMTAGEGPKRGSAPVSAPLAKISKKLGQVRELSSPAEKYLPQWTVEEAQRIEKRIDPQLAQRLVELTGGRVDRIVSELEKLALYVGEAQTIDAAAVEAVTSISEEATVFELVDSIGQQDALAALAALSCLLTGLSGGELTGAALGAVGMIARQLRLLWQIRVAVREGVRLDRGQELPVELGDKFPQQHDIAGAVGNRDWLARKLTAQARNFGDVQLARGLARVYETDLWIKGQAGRQSDPRLALETLVVELCQM